MGGPLQPLRAAVENPSVDPSPIEESESGPEHFLAALHGTLAVLLGATVWSAMAAVFGLWSLPAAPGLGWLVAWACREGGRRMDPFVRISACLLSLAGGLLALSAFSVFSVTQSSPDSGFQIRAVALEYLRLFAEPPWFGSATVLLTLAGAWRALRGPSSLRPAAIRTGERQVPAPGGAHPGAPRAAAAEGPDSRAA